MCMKSFHDEAIVLRKHSVKEKDEVVVLLTKNQGKMALMSYGSRDPKSRKAGVLEIFNTIAFEARYGKTAMAVLQQVKPVVNRAFGVVHADNDDLTLFYRASSILKYAHDSLQDLQSVQNVYSDLNVALDSIQEPVSEILFKIKFLQDMGFLPDLSLCCVCEEILAADDEMCFVSEHTGFAHSHCCRMSADNSIVIKSVDSILVKFMKHYQRVSYHEALQVSISESMIQEISQLLSSGTSMSDF